MEPAGGRDAWAAISPASWADGLAPFAPPGRRVPYERLPARGGEARRTEASRMARIGWPGHLLAFLMVLLLQPGPSFAGAPRPTAPRFEVTIAPGLDTGRGRDGRLLVVLGRPAAGEPRLSFGRTGMDAA